MNTLDLENDFKLEADRLAARAEELLLTDTAGFHRPNHINLAIQLFDCYKQSKTLASATAELLEDAGYEVTITNTDGVDLLLASAEMHLRIAEALR